MANFSASAPPAAGPAPCPAESHQAPHDSNQSKGSPLEGSDFAFVRGEHVENPLDALRVLAAAANESGDAPQAEAPLASGPAGWEDWELIQRGLLTRDEAARYFEIFATHLHPCYTLVQPDFFHPTELPHLIRHELILLAAIIVVASRYHPPAASVAEEQRNLIVHAQCLDWLLQRLGMLLLGDSTLRQLGTVEGLLLLAEFPPRSNLLKNSAFSFLAPQTSGKQGIQSVLESSKVYDQLSWSLIGTAVRTAQELNLDRAETYSATPTTSRDQNGRRRFHTWLYCSQADRHVSVRLGRSSLIQEMGTRWWDSVELATRQQGDATFPFPRAAPVYRLDRAFAELTHTIGVMQDLLYPSPEATEELLRSGRYEGVLRRLKDELDALWRWHFDLNEADALSKAHLQVEWEYLRLYANGISLRASQERLLRRLKGNAQAAETTNAVFSSNVFRSVEGPYVLEAVEAAMSLLRTCIDVFHARGALRYCPARMFLRMTFACVFLLKALTFGAIKSSEADVMVLQQAAVNALAAAAGDEEHMPGQFAQLLARLLQLPTPVTSQASKLDATPAAATPGPSTLGNTTGDDGANTGGYDNFGGLFDLPFLDETRMAATHEQDQLLASLWAGDGGNNLLSTLWTNDVFEELNFL